MYNPHKTLPMDIFGTETRQEWAVAIATWGLMADMTLGWFLNKFTTEGEHCSSKIFLFKGFSFDQLFKHLSFMVVSFNM